MRANTDRSWMVQPSASPARIAKSTAVRFRTGSAPGSPRQTGQMWVFGSAPNAALQPQKIFDAVSSCAWTSSPMTDSKDANIQAFGPAASTSALTPCSKVLKFSTNMRASFAACAS